MGATFTEGVGARITEHSPGELPWARQDRDALDVVVVGAMVGEGVVVTPACALVLQVPPFVVGAQP